MNEQLDLDNLRRWVYDRRQELDLTHMDVQQLGGPSTTTMTKIEAGRGPAPRRDVIRRLEHVLGWERGSVRRILAGGAPIMEAPTSTGSRRLAALIDDYEQREGATDEAVARTVGLSPSDLRAWRAEGVSKLPAAETLRRLADLIGVDETVTFYAAGVDAGYIAERTIETELDLAAGMESGRIAARRRSKD